MGELSNKEKEVIAFLLEFVNFEVFKIEEGEIARGKLDYSLCSDDAEKLIVTNDRITKYKKRINKVDPSIASYINVLTTPSQFDTEFEDLKTIITRNFLLNEYSELVETLTNENIEELEIYHFKGVLKSLGFKYKHLKDFIQGICDVNSFFTYKSFLDISNNNNLNYDVTIQKLNNAFFRLESFMNGTLKEYIHFDFNTTFTELFYLTKKPEHFTYENCKRIGQYWDITEHIRVDFDHDNFENEEASENVAFNEDCNMLMYINLDRLEEFMEFQTPDEGEEQTRTNSITDLMRAQVKAVEMLNNGISTTTNIKEENINPHPRIFKDYYSYNVFLKLNEEFGNSKENLSNYSYVFHKMTYEGLIHFDILHKTYIDLLFDMDIKIDKIKSKSEIGKIALRDSIYTKVK